MSTFERQLGNAGFVDLSQTHSFHSLVLPEGRFSQR
jgi:hypothetical protein